MRGYTPYKPQLLAAAHTWDRTENSSTRIDLDADTLHKSKPEIVFRILNKGDRRVYLVWGPKAEPGAASFDLPDPLPLFWVEPADDPEEAQPVDMGPFSFWTKLDFHVVAPDPDFDGEGEPAAPVDVQVDVLITFSGAS